MANYRKLYAASPTVVVFFGFLVIFPHIRRCGYFSSSSFGNFAQIPTAEQN